MSVLSDRDIYDAIQKRMFSIEPLVADNVQPGSIDLTLHHDIEIFSHDGVLDPERTTPEEILRGITKKSLRDSPHELAPGAFVTGYSAERIRLSSFLGGRLYNRNSLAKCGLDATISRFVNPGYEGRKIIVIRNIGDWPILLHAGMRICQLELHMLSSQAMRGYADRHDIGPIIPVIESRLKGMPLTYTANYRDRPLSEIMQQCIDDVVRGE